MKTMTKRKFQNRLNDLNSKTWLKFQKSWFIHNPPPRRKDVLLHPAKFPESLAQEFIEFFTKQGQVVLDPMVGTGSTQIAALRSGRHSYGIELNPKYAEIARQIFAKLWNAWLRWLSPVMQENFPNSLQNMKFLLLTT